MKKDDLISRAALLDEFYSLCGPQTGDGWDNMGVRNLIRRQKAVDAAPVVHARWEPSNDYNGYCRCSVCHDTYIDPDWIIDGKWQYCPHCGAKMDSERRDSE